eukprot:jgi/Botrbrau1/12272/Bobra.0323s0012.1
MALRKPAVRFSAVVRGLQLILPCPLKPTYLFSQSPPPSFHILQEDSVSLCCCLRLLLLLHWTLPENLTARCPV